MLQPIAHILEHKRIVLASLSPRRREILLNIGLKFECVPSTFLEDLDVTQFNNHGDFAIETAHRKVLEVAERLSSDRKPPDVVIGADTVVSFGGKIYGKPDDAKMAAEYLYQLSGRQHTVYTGVVIKTREAIVKFCESTLVQMAFLSEDIIQGYVRSKEPLDKAGAYGIQGFGGSLIERIEGDFYTVMGLPLHSFCKHLAWLYSDKAKELAPSRSNGDEDKPSDTTV